MMPGAAMLSRTPGEPDRGGKLFKKVENCRGTTFKVSKNHLVESESGWSTGHSLCGTTSVTRMHQGNAAFSTF